MSRLEIVVPVCKTDFLDEALAGIAAQIYPDFRVYIGTMLRQMT